MGNDSTSSIVFLLVSLVIAATIGGMVIQYSQQISYSIKEKGSNLSKELKTGISIINDPEYMQKNVDGENVIVLFVKNTGSVPLDNSADVVDIFVDGKYMRKENIQNFPVVNDSEWVSSSVAKIVTDYTPDSGDHKVKIEVNDTKDSLEFIIE